MQQRAGVEATSLPFCGGVLAPNATTGRMRDNLVEQGRSAQCVEAVAPDVSEAPR